MNPSLKRTLIWVWNTLLLACALFVTLVFLPKAMDIYRHPMVPVEDVLGLQGVALVLLAWMCAASLASPCWFRVPIWFRIVLELGVAALVIGYFLAARRWDQSPLQPEPYASPMDLLTFFGTMAAFLWPLLLLGRGYPALLQRWFAKSDGASPTRG